MEPAYKPGDHVLTFSWPEIKKGDVIAFKDKGKAYLKRIDKIQDDIVYISGNNKKESAKMGPIKKPQIVGKVIFKY